MKLADYQRAVLRQSMALHSEDELPELALYRQMIRTRFTDMAQLAFKQTWAMLGARRCQASVERCLAEAPPQSPILRNVIARFADFALHDRMLLADAPPAAADMLRFEATKWAVSSMEAQLSERVVLREVDFDGVLVCNPTLVCLRLGHAVWMTTSSVEACRADVHTLLVYRARDADDVRWYRAPDVLVDLLAPTDPDRTLGEAVRSLLALADDRAPEVLLEQVASALTIAVERGVLWGVRDPAHGARSDLA